MSCRRRRHAQYVLPAAVPLTNQALRRLGGINGAIRANVIATTNSGQGVWLPKQKSVYLALASGPLTGAPAQTRSPTCARISRRARLEHSDAACAAESRVRGALVPHPGAPRPPPCGAIASRARGYAVQMRRSARVGGVDCRTTDGGAEGRSSMRSI